MKSFPSSSQKSQLLRFVPFIVSFLVAQLGGWLLIKSSIIDGLISFIINIGLDEKRTELITALLMTAAAALVGAVLGRRLLAAVLGAGLIFWFYYLQGFIQLQLQPHHDPGGHLEPLNSGALVHTSFTMIALALLSAFAGAAVGVAFGEVFLDPPYRLARAAWLYFKEKQNKLTSSLGETARKKTIMGAVGSWVLTIIMLILLVLASGSSDLLVYSPDTGLFLPPILSNTHDTPVKYGTGTTLQDSVLSQALGGQSKPFMVYLPPSYKTPQGRNIHYPTLYLLHGTPGSDKDWFAADNANQSADTLIASDKIRELILILPDGNGRPRESSEWGNSFDQKQLIENYVAFDLVHYVDQKYRTIISPAYRGIGGLSTGGFGAMNIAVHHPDIFGFVISLAGYYYAEGSIWGNNAAYMQQNSPALYLPLHQQSWHLHIFLGAATQDMPYYTDTLNFASELKSLHIPYNLDIEPGGHERAVWQVQIYKALIWLRWG